MPELASKNYFQHWWNLPPEFSGCPERGSIGTNNRCTNCSNSTINIRVTVTGNTKSARFHKSIFQHHLMTDTTTCRMESDALIRCKFFNPGILFDIGFALVLDVVIKGVNRLVRVVNVGNTKAFKLVHNSCSVIVSHDMIGNQGHKITGVKFCRFRKIDCVGLGDFFNDCLSHFIPRENWL